MDWTYYLIKFGRMLFWTEVMLFLFFSLVQFTTADTSTMMYAIPLAALFLYAPAIVTFMTVVGVRDEQYEKERKSMRKKKRGNERRNVTVRTNGKRRR